MPVTLHITCALVIVAALAPRAAADNDERGAGATESVSLDALIEVAVRRSPGLARTRAEVDVARGEERAVRGRDDWRLQVEARTSRTTTAPVPDQPVQVTSREQRSGTASLVRDLPTGGELELSANATRIDEVHRTLSTAMTGMDPTQGEPASTSEPVDTPTGVSRAGGRVRLTHSLLRGFGTGVARADRERARLATSAAELRAEERAGALLGQVINAFWDLSLAAETLEVRRASLATARKLRKEAKAAVREGTRPSSDLKVADYVTAVREAAVLEAEIALAQQSLAVRDVAGLELGPDSIYLAPVEQPAVSARRLSVSAQVRRGLARNRELAALLRDERSGDVDVAVAKNAARPRLDLVASAGVTGAGPDVDQAVTALGEKADVDASLGLVFSMDLGGNSARGQLMSARARRRLVRIAIEERRRQVTSQIVLAVHRVRASQKRVEVAAKAIELARANLSAERARFRVGAVSSREMFERADELDDARLSKARAAADYHRSLAALEMLTGDILERYNVEVIR